MIAHVCVLVFRRLRQEDHCSFETILGDTEFQASVGYRENFFSKERE